MSTDRAALPSLDSLRINFAWLIRLRWGAIVGQLALTLFVDRVMGVALPLDLLGALLAGECLVNAVSLLWVRRAPFVREHHLALAMALDLLLFTGMLYVTGGPSNPFSSLYLIHIALAAVVLPPRWSWALVVLALACSAALFLGHLPLIEDPAHAQHRHHGHQGEFDWHLRGMWVALGVAASFIVYFLHRVTRALRERDRELALSRERALRNERITSVATLAAGAAHELASPLGTIAVASGELEAELRKSSASARAVEDVVLIREQVRRCRAILDQLGADSGQAAGDPISPIVPRELAELALSNLTGRERVRVDATGSPPVLMAPPRALVQAVRSLLENALHATQAHQRVDLAIARAAADQVRIEVSDPGVGMSREVLDRATEPFFTTRGAGRGLGLGLFLAQSVADQLGGRLELSSQPGRGTRATLVFPSRLLPGACSVPT
ncbi:MAG TPA: ATP-binding protein [Polyangiaceae bacterium]